MVGRLSLTLAIAAVLTLGCARPPAPGEPIGGDDLRLLALILSQPGAGVTGLRGSGSGEVTVSGLGTALSFAFVYSDPGWLRVDVRPELGAAGHAFSSLSVLDGQCLRTYFPGKAAEVRGCLSDLTAAVPDLDLAALALGIPRLAFLAELEDARLARDGDTIVLSGVLAGRRLTLATEGSPPSVSQVSLELKPGGRTLSVTYAGRGWHAPTPLPRTIDIALLGERPEGRLKLELRKARTDDHIAREDYDVEVPPGSRSLTWDDLEFGRER